MSDTPRFEPDVAYIGTRHCIPEMTECENGEFVTFEAYEALTAQLKEEREKVEWLEQLNKSQAESSADRSRGIARLTALLKESERDVTRLRALLTKHQWAYSDWECCPECHGTYLGAEPTGHMPNCELEAALDATKGDQ